MNACSGFYYFVWEIEGPFV